LDAPSTTVCASLIFDKRVTSNELITRWYWRRKVVAPAALIPRAVTKSMATSNRVRTDHPRRICCADFPEADTFQYEGALHGGRGVARHYSVVTT